MVLIYYFLTACAHYIGFKKLMITVRLLNADFERMWMETTVAYFNVLVRNLPEPPEHHLEVLTTYYTGIPHSGYHSSLVCVCVCVCVRVYEHDVRQLE
jgi:DNA polymerase III epsilon subunit-like protein